MTLNLQRFLMEGALGPITLGQAPADIKVELGEPEDVAGGGKRAWIWKYGDIQVAFDDGKVVLLGIYPEGNPLPWQASLAIGCPPPELRDFAWLHRFIHCKGISCRVDLASTFGSWICLVVGDRTRVFAERNAGLVEKILVSSGGQMANRIVDCSYLLM
jgi:hypothetical protein